MRTRLLTSLYCASGARVGAALLLLLGGWQQAGAQAPALTTLLTNGPTTNRFNIVVLSEGYTSNQLDQFLTDAANAVDGPDGLLSHEPYQEYRSFFNVFAIAVPSKGQGSSHPSDGIYTNTYFGSTYDLTDHIITIPTTGQAKVDALVKSLMPQCNLAVLLVNEPFRSGGSDGFNKTAIAATGPMSSEILTHETGHVLGGLGDEYETPYPGFPDVEEPNTTRETRRAYIKWGAWIDPGTPLPTPETADYTGVIGLFQGAHYHTTGWYRPKFDCAMNSLVVPFCEVCREALVCAIYRKVRPVDSFAPASTSLSLSPGQTVAFSLNTPSPATHSMAAQWFLDSVAIPGETNLTFSPQQPLAGGHLISAVVQDNTSFVRNDPTGLLRQTVAWNINGGFSNLAQNLTLTLTAYVQGTVTSNASAVARVPIASKDIIRALNQVMPQVTFSPTAKLMLIRTAGDGPTRIVVRDTVNLVSPDTDVSGYFTSSNCAAVTRFSISNYGQLSGTSYVLQGFNFASDALTLNLQGLATLTLPSGVMTASMAGSGTVTNAPAVFQGTLRLSAGKLELVH